MSNANQKVEKAKGKSKNAAKAKATVQAFVEGESQERPSVLGVTNPRSRQPHVLMMISEGKNVTVEEIAKSVGIKEDRVKRILRVLNKAELIEKDPPDASYDEALFSLKSKSSIGKYEKMVEANNHRGLRSSEFEKKEA